VSGAERRPAVGYALAAAAASMWALNGSIARFLLDDGVSPARLSQLRSFGAFVVLLAVVGVACPALLRVERRDVRDLAFLGIAGLALVHAAYFAAIDRLQIGVALTIQYLAPVLLLLWLRFRHGRRLRRGLWGAVALSVAGCFFVVRAYDADALDGLGVAAALAAAVTFALYMVGSERAGQRYRPATTLVWAFGFASLFWALVQPWWDFPFERFDTGDAVLEGLGVVVIGTLLPFLCIVAALRHLPAPRAAVVATLEPVLAAAFAWAIHEEPLAAVQVAGGCAVIAAVAWVQSHRPDPDQEAAPALARASNRR
jgi:drug/metabolite transporter (DMT)-like permease